jgi:hypothetical protein
LVYAFFGKSEKSGGRAMLSQWARLATDAFLQESLWHNLPALHREVGQRGIF